MNEISQKQLEANRENSKLGGVKTEEGKSVSKMNALKHGLLSSQVLFLGEDEQDFKILESNLMCQLEPVDQMEALLVDRIISGFWRLRRILKIETSLMSFQTYDTLNNVIFCKEGAQAVKDVCDMLNNSLLDRSLRYENNIERGIFKAVYELQRIKSEHKNTKFLEI